MSLDVSKSHILKCTEEFIEDMVQIMERNKI